MVVLALAVYWGAKQGYIGGQVIGKIFGLTPPAGDAAVEQVTKNTNARLPRMLNADISFDRVTVNTGQEVILHYRFVDLDQQAVMQRYAVALPELQKAIIQDVCGDEAIRKYVFAGGYAAQVILRAQDRKTITNTYVRADRCR